MPYLDRASFIALLDRLGSADDSEALAAAREIDRRKRDAGATWADLLAPVPGAADKDAAETLTGYGGAFSDDDETAADRRTANTAHDLTLIERLLADHDLSEDTRRELLDFRDDIAEGEFTGLDSRYLRNLESRLNRRSRAVPDV